MDLALVITNDGSDLLKKSLSHYGILGEFDGVAILEWQKDECLVLPMKKIANNWWNIHENLGKYVCVGEDSYRTIPKTIKQDLLSMSDKLCARLQKYLTHSWDPSQEPQKVTMLQEKAVNEEIPFRSSNNYSEVRLDSNEVS